MEHIVLNYYLLIHELDNNKKNILLALVWFGYFDYIVVWFFWFGLVLTKLVARSSQNRNLKSSITCQSFL